MRKRLIIRMYVCDRHTYFIEPAELLPKTISEICMQIKIKEFEDIYPCLIIETEKSIIYFNCNE